MDILTYQKRCWDEYKQMLKLPESYTYLYGNPVKVHVPVDVATGGLMIIGAYPTAQFNTINGINDVPVADHLIPFSNDTYFDGSRIRRVRSGEELEEFFLKKLDYPRNRCWITDLVKVFLFKEGHIKKYEQLGFHGHVANRKDFVKLAQKSLDCLYDELQIAKPKAILLLGEEVTSVVMCVSNIVANSLLKEGLLEKEINGTNYNIIASPHPGILMRGGEISEKWRKISARQLEILKQFL